MFEFIKKTFIAAMRFVDCGALISSNPLKFVTMSKQECKVRSAMVNINSNVLYFINTTFLLINAVVAAMILTTRTQKYVFLMLLKI